ncbi:MAG: hypothetical protein R3C97_00515 [Geminicoccaceae bacterium]
MRKGEFFRSRDEGDGRARQPGVDWIRYHYDKIFKVFIGDYRKTGSIYRAMRDLYSKTYPRGARSVLRVRNRSTVFIAANAAAKAGTVLVTVAAFMPLWTLQAEGVNSG